MFTSYSVANILLVSDIQSAKYEKLRKYCLFFLNCAVTMAYATIKDAFTQNCFFFFFLFQCDYSVRFCKNLFKTNYEHIRFDEEQLQMFRCTTLKKQINFHHSSEVSCLVFSPFYVTFFFQLLEAVTRSSSIEKHITKSLKSSQESTCARVSFFMRLQVAGHNFMEKRPSSYVLL